MAKTWKEIRRKTASLHASQKNLKAVQGEYQRIARIQYSLPSPLNEFDWVRPIKSAAPYNALRGVKRALSNKKLSLTVDPVTVTKASGDKRDSDASKKLANKWETIIKWQMGLANKRRAAMQSSKVESAALYDEVVGQWIHVPTQFKLAGKEPTRLEAALRFGDWALRLANPQNVYVEYSDFMPERVVSIQKKLPQEIVDFWGDKAKVIKSKMKDDDYAGKHLIEIDYVDYDARAVWVVEEITEIADSKGIVIMAPKPWLTIAVGEKKGQPVPFLNWIAVAGGTDLDIEPEHQRQPLFYSVYHAELWAAANITKTLQMSEAISTFAGPKYAVTDMGGSAEDVEIDHGQPGGRVDLTTFQKFEILRQEGLDPAITESYDRVNDEIKETTGAEILVTAAPMGGVEAFAAYNLQIQVALAGLGGVKHLEERFEEEIATTMLLMAHYTGEDIIGYDDPEWTISHDEIDPSRIYMGVELNVDVPVDRVQRITAASQLAQPHFRYPMERIIEFLGDTDPQGAARLYYKEQFKDAYIAGVLQKVQAEGSGEMEQMRQMLEQLMQQQEQMAQAAQQQQGPGRTPQGPGGLEGVGGPEFNPAEGGLPPATVAPGATRETQTGRTQGGMPIAEVF